MEDCKMRSRLRLTLSACIAIVMLGFAFVMACHAGSATLIYDDVNRLIRVDYGDGWSIIYDYDRYGNRTEKRVVASGDVTPPVTTASPPGGSYSSAQSVILTCTDVGGSECDPSHLHYTTNGDAPTTQSPVYSGPINISQTTTLKFFSKDLAGNTESPFNTEEYIVDSTPPQGTITINGGAASTANINVTLTLSCSDAQTTCSQMIFSNDGSSYSAAEPYGTTKSWTLATGAGTRTVYVKVSDTAAKWSGSFNDTILLETVVDTTPPTGTITINSGADVTSDRNVMLTLSCTDDYSGCSEMQFSNNGVGYTTPEPYGTAAAWILALGEGTRTVYARFKDLAGNWSVTYSDTIELDSNYGAQIAGMHHSLAVSTDGTLWGWGFNDYGQLGDGGTEDKLSAIQIGTDTT
jgi:YD repeat-containing protein